MYNFVNMRSRPETSEDMDIFSPAAAAVVIIILVMLLFRRRERPLKTVVYKRTLGIS